MAATNSEMVYEKQFSSDMRNEPYTLHRDVLASEVVFEDIQENSPPTLGDLFLSNGAALAKMRVWVGGAAASAAVGEVVRLRIWSFPAPKDIPADTGQGSGILLADITLEFNGVVTADETHPCDGSATPGIRWYEASVRSATTYQQSEVAFTQAPEVASAFEDITPVDMIQDCTIVTPGSVTDWTLTFRGQTTEDMADTITAGDMEDALEALSTIGAGNVTVTEAVDKIYLITFTKDLGGRQQPLLVAGLGSTPPLTSATVTEDTEGISGRAIVFGIDILADRSLYGEIVSMDGTGNATKVAVGLKRVQ